MSPIPELMEIRCEWDDEVQLQIGSGSPIHLEARNFEVGAALLSAVRKLEQVGFKMPVLHRIRIVGLEGGAGQRRGRKEKQEPQDGRFHPHRLPV
jgi:hypothetical protein